MLIDVEVAAGGDREIEATMTRDEIEHVIEKADAGPILEAAAAVEIDRDADRRLGGLASDYAFPHSSSSARDGLRVCSTTPVVIAEAVGQYGSFERSRTSTPLAMSPSTSARVR